LDNYILYNDYHRKNLNCWEGGTKKTMGETIMIGIPTLLSWSVLVHKIGKIKFPKIPWPKWEYIANSYTPVL
jgi:hypothetical protein